MELLSKSRQQFRRGLFPPHGMSNPFLHLRSLRQNPGARSAERQVLNRILTAERHFVVEIGIDVQSKPLAESLIRVHNIHSRLSCSVLPTPAANA